MIVAQEKTGYYGITAEVQRPVKYRRRKAAPRWHMLVLTGLIFACFLVGVLITYYYAQVFLLGNRIHHLEKELALLRVENHNLDGEIHRLATLERVEFLAVAKLGMVKPDSDNVFVVTVTSNAPQENDTNPQAGHAAELPPAGENKSRLIRAFTELVNRLEQKTWLGYGPGTLSLEGKNANNEHSDPKENNVSLSNGCNGTLRVDFSFGMAAAC